MKTRHHFILRVAGLMCGFMFCSDSLAQLSVSIRLDEEPFRYEQTQADNRVSRLIAKLESKDIELRYSDDHGYLRDLLKELEIPESSQALVFSKTSMQAHHISRLNPRAIFFNDDTHVGWIRGSSLIEISTFDPRLGAAFYSFDMVPWRAKLRRINDECLGCHSSSLTQGIPGHTVRSVFPTADGSVDVRRESFVTSDASPFSERWGGWYVTGTHGDAIHMGNAWLQNGVFDKSRKGNLLDLENEFDTKGYLSSHSDIVALMVLEHQTQMLNTLTKANFSVRKILHERETIGDPIADDERLDAEISMLARSVVEQLLFCNEAKLTNSVKGTTAFADEFIARGPFDKQGRSLREFDLNTRLFRFPCSYLIYGESFDSLHPRLRNEILQQLLLVLRGEDKSPKFKHLDEATRLAITSILAFTKANLPADWPFAASSR